MRIKPIFHYILFLLIISGCEMARKEESQSKETTSSAILTNQTNESGDIGLKIGQQAPDIILPDSGGELKTLSSLRGKIILVDFWASWCGPCRYENPNVVAAYNKFKDKNFTILGVSLDQDKKAWLRAIEADGMEWNHVSDLKKWESSIVPVYKINSIPMTFLLDQKGIIIAKDLRGADLEKKLASIIEKK